MGRNAKLDVEQQGVMDDSDEVTQDDEAESVVWWRGSREDVHFGGGALKSGALVGGGDGGQACPVANLGEIAQFRSEERRS